MRSNHKRTAGEGHEDAEFRLQHAEIRILHDGERPSPEEKLAEVGGLERGPFRQENVQSVNE